MAKDNFLVWLANETPTEWWHDSGEQAELEEGLGNGATGGTAAGGFAYLNTNEIGGVIFELIQRKAPRATLNNCNY